MIMGLRGAAGSFLFMTLLVACGSADNTGQVSNGGSGGDSSEGGAGSGQSGQSGSMGAGGSGASGASGTGGAVAMDSGGGGALVVPIKEEPQGTALNIPCDALLGVNGADLLILLPTSLVKIGPSSVTAPVVTAPSNYFQGANDFAVDGTTLFWSNYQSIQSLSFSGGTPAMLPVSNKDVISGPDELAVHDAYLYFSHINDGNLYRVAIDGKTPDQQIGTFPMARKGTATNGIAWIGDRVYWGFDELVMSAPVAGGGASTMVLQASRAYASLFGATGSAIFWGGPTEGFVRTTLPADKATLLANPIDSRIGAFDGTTMFGVRANAAGNPQIVSVPAAGGAATEIAAAGSQRTVKQLLVTTQHVYWTATRQCATPFECPMGTCEARRFPKP